MKPLPAGRDVPVSIGIIETRDNGAAAMQDNEDPVVLADLPGEIEAQLIIAALEDEGIKAFKSGGALADFKLGIPGNVQVLVRPEDLERAQDAFSHLRDEDGDIDWSRIDVGESEE